MFDAWGNAWLRRLAAQTYRDGLSCNACTNCVAAITALAAYKDLTNGKGRERYIDNGRCHIDEGVGQYGCETQEDDVAQEVIPPLVHLLLEMLQAPWPDGPRQLCAQQPRHPVAAA